MNIEIYSDIRATRHKGLDILDAKALETFQSLSGTLSAIRVYVDRYNGQPACGFDDMRAIVDAYGPMGYEVRAVYWPKPYSRSRYFDRVWGFTEITKNGPVFNVEGNIVSLSKRRRFGRSLLELGGKDLEEGAILTTHPGHPEAFIDRALIARNVRREVQAYSTSTNIRRAGKRAAPIVLQRRAAAMSEVFGHRPHIALACYGQSRLHSALRELNIPSPFHPHAHMKACLEAAHMSEVSIATYWSVKHLWRNDYALLFFLDEMPRVLERMSVLAPSET